MNETPDFNQLAELLDDLLDYQDRYINLNNSWMSADDFDTSQNKRKEVLDILLLLTELKVDNK